MNKSLFQNPKALIIIGVVIAVIPIFFSNENFLVLMRLASFVLFFYAIHLFFKKKKVVKK